LFFSVTLFLKARATPQDLDLFDNNYVLIFYRIYIKKVRKFPEFKIDMNLEKRTAKLLMDKAFHGLKQQNIEKIGQDRWVVF